MWAASVYQVAVKSGASSPSPSSAARVWAYVTSPTVSVGANSKASRLYVAVLDSCPSTRMFVALPADASTGLTTYSHTTGAQPV